MLSGGIVSSVSSASLLIVFNVVQMNSPKKSMTSKTVKHEVMGRRSKT